MLRKTYSMYCLPPPPDVDTTYLGVAVPENLTERPEYRHGIDVTLGFDRRESFEVEERVRA